LAIPFRILQFLADLFEVDGVFFILLFPSTIKVKNHQSKNFSIWWIFYQFLAFDHIKIKIIFYLWRF